MIFFFRVEWCDLYCFGGNFIVYCFIGEREEGFGYVVVLDLVWFFDFRFFWVREVMVIYILYRVFSRGL